MKQPQQDPKPCIIYGIQGEGRGHATRALQVLRTLEEKGYHVSIYTGGDAAHFLKQHGYQVRKIPLLRYHYTKNGNISFVKTFFYNFINTFKLLTEIDATYKVMFKEIQRWNPFLIISDFEVYSSRIANKLGIPLYSVHHQHLFTESQLPKLKTLSDSIRTFTCILSTKMVTGKPSKSFASSFFHFPPKASSQAFFIGPFLEKSWQKRVFTDQGHITVYMKKPCYLAYLETIFKAFPHLSFHVFSDFKGSYQYMKPFPCVQYNEISREEFLNSFANCKALVATAGNQVIGEAIYAHKPLLVAPEPNALEQKFNAIGLTQSGLGMAVDLEEISPNTFLKFLNEYAENTKFSNVLVPLERYDGTQVVIQHIDSLYQRIATNSSNIFNPSRDTAKYPVLAYKVEIV